MTEKQQELYIRTKARLRRMGKENPADVIVALAEEIDRYREKIHAMEEFIAKRERKRGNETGIVAELRNKTSRDNRDLLDRAADRIEELEASQHKQSEGEWIDQYNGKYANPIYVCSLCGKGTLLTPYINELNNMEMVQALSSFCPNCGAKMKGE